MLQQSIFHLLESAFWAVVNAKYIVGVDRGENNVRYVPVRVVLLRVQLPIMESSFTTPETRNMRSVDLLCKSAEMSTAHAFRPPVPVSDSTRVLR